jgi:hypothetical protein
MQLIVFNPIKTPFKIPKSPYNDNTFNFTPLNVKDLDEAFKILASNYTLVHNLNIPKTVRITRKNKDLKPLLAIQSYMILDIDCKTKSDVKGVLDYFKEFNCILGESRTFKEYSYGIKGILKIQQSNDIEYFKIFKKIQNDLNPYGILDERILYPYHFIYPIEKIRILQSTKGTIFKHSEFTQTTTAVDCILKSNDYNDMCLEYFKHLGFKKVSQNEYEYNNKKYHLSRPYIMSSGVDSINIYEKIETIQAQKIKSFISDYSSNLTIDCEFLTQHDFNFKDFFKNYDVLAIKSYMGSKKSEVIKRIIQTKSKVLVVTPRISLALEYNSKFKLPVYLNVNFKKTDDYYKTNYKKGDSLICQYDSLHKINPKDFDYVVMDEYVSILLHSIDNLSKLKKENLIKFKSLFKKKLIISDAFLNDYLLDFSDKIYKIENTYKMNVNFIEHTTKQNFLDSILESINQGEKISISTNSVNLIYNDILKLTEGLDKSIAVIEGQDQETKKKESIKNLNSHYLNSDIIIYSPAITVGVSIFNNITKHFHYDGSNSIDTIQSIQMLGRTRLTKDIEYFIQGKHQYMRLGKENEEWEIKNRHKSSDNSFYFDLDENGDIILSELGKFYLKIKMFLRFLKFDTLSSFKLLLGCNYSN